MITGFEYETAPLTEYEEKVLLPVIVAGLKTKVGVENAVTNKQIVAGMKAKGYEITEVRVNLPEPFTHVLATLKSPNDKWVEIVGFDGKNFQLPGRGNTDFVTGWMEIPKPYQQ